MVTMNFFGIGPLEIVLVLVLVLIVFGPKDLQNAGKTLGRILNSIIHSDNWKQINKTRMEINNLPKRLMKDAALEEVKENIMGEMTGVSADLGKVIGDINSPPKIQPPVLPVAARDSGPQKLDKKANGQDRA
jgi:Sec-independent protein translocase protein TatA